MTAKEKAEELVEKFRDDPRMFSPLDLDDSKQCALICVDEIMGALNEIPFVNQTEYWQEVKQEIEKL